MDIIPFKPSVTAPSRRSDPTNRVAALLWMLGCIAIVACDEAGSEEPDTRSTDTNDSIRPDVPIDDTEIVPDLFVDSDDTTEPALDAERDGDTPEMDATETDSNADTEQADTDVGADAEAIAPPDNDQDGVADSSDGCPEGSRGWVSSAETDHDQDGCRDSTEDDDDDNDGVEDTSDACPLGVTGWESSPVTDLRGDGCIDEVEDDDDDGDGVADESDLCPAGATAWTSEPANDHDQDGCRDLDEDDDLDGDGVADDIDVCPNLYDPHQIDTAAPYGVGHGDLCTLGCMTIDWLETVVQTTNIPVELYGWVWFDRYPGIWHRGSGQWVGRIGSVERLSVTKSGSHCVMASHRFEPNSSPVGLLLEVSAAGGNVEDRAGFTRHHPHILAFGTAMSDRDGDGLQEPWDIDSICDTDLLSSDRITGNTIFSGGNVCFQLISTTSRATIKPMSGEESYHILLSDPWYTSDSGPARVRITVDGQEVLLEDFQGTEPRMVFYLGDYLKNERIFVPRKKCAHTNAACALDSDCSSGPCIFRRFRR